MKIFTFTVSALIVLSMPLLLLAQSPVALSKKLEASLKAKDNHRKLKETMDDGRHIEQEWSIEGKKVVVLVYEYESAQEAKKEMEMSRLNIADASGLEPLHGFGDDAYVTGGLRGGTAHLTMRRGKRYIVIHANRALAKKLGREVASVLAQN